MRLIDLIHYISMTSEIYYRQSLSDHERLMMIKLAFPRADLVRWFDECVPVTLPAERYMPLLLMTAAAIICPPHMHQLHYGSQADLDLFQCLRPAHRGPNTDSILIDQAAGAIATRFAAYASNEIGLIQGICDETVDHGCESVMFALTVPGLNARRLCILSDPKYGEYLNRSEPWQGHLVYQGILQHWPERSSCVIFRSYIKPAEQPP